MTTQHVAKECPRWVGCSVNNCPLDPHTKHPEDRETTCPMEKGVRVRIAAKYPGLLPMEGLTAREWAGKAAFDRLSPAVKSQRAETGRKLLAALNATKTTKV